MKIEFKSEMQAHISSIKIGCLFLSIESYFLFLQRKNVRPCL